MSRELLFAMDNPFNRMLTTQEISSPDSKCKFKMPDACNALNVTYFNTIEMLRIL